MRRDCTKKPMAARDGVSAGRQWCAMNAVDRVIRWSTAVAVIGTAAIAAVVSYEHAYALVRMHGEAGWTGRLVPLTVDGLIYASSMVMLDSARRKVPVPPLARWLLGLGLRRRSRPTWRTASATGCLVPWWLRGLRSRLSAHMSCSW